MEFLVRRTYAGCKELFLQPKFELWIRLFQQDEPLGLVVLAKIE
jgi:hypothetical protein